jgi:hypothetical protein
VSSSGESTTSNGGKELLREQFLASDPDLWPFPLGPLVAPPARPVRSELDLSRVKWPVTIRNLSGLVALRLSNGLIAMELASQDIGGTGAGSVRDNTLRAKLLLPSCKQWLESHQHDDKAPQDLLDTMERLANLVRSGGVCLNQTKRSMYEMAQRSTRQSQKAPGTADVYPNTSSGMTPVIADGLLGAEEAVHLAIKELAQANSAPPMAELRLRVLEKGFRVQLSLFSQRKNEVDGHLRFQLARGLNKVARHAQDLSHAQLAGELAAAMLEQASQSQLGEPWDKLPALHLGAPVSITELEKLLDQLVKPTNNERVILQRCLHLGQHIASFQTDLAHRPDQPFWGAARKRYTSYIDTARSINNARKTRTPSVIPDSALEQVRQNSLKEFADWVSKRLTSDFQDEHLGHWPDAGVNPNALAGRPA